MGECFSPLVKGMFAVEGFLNITCYQKRIPLSVFLKILLLTREPQGLIILFFILKTLHGVFLSYCIFIEILFKALHKVFVVCVFNSLEVAVGLIATL